MKHMQFEKNWTKQEDNLLLNCVDLYGRDWDKISKSMRVKSKQVLEERYKCLINQKQKPIWTLDEDILLLQMVDKLGKDWEMVQKVVKTKDIPSCKRRFAKIRDSCLNLEQEDKDLIVLNQHWYKEDDEMLLFLYELYGGNWSEIFKRLPERAIKHIQDEFKNKGLANQLHKWNQEKDTRLMTYALYGIPFSQFEQETGFSIIQCEERLKKIIFKISKQLQQPRKTKEQKQFDEIMQFNNNSNKKSTKNNNLKIQSQEIEKQQYFSQFEQVLYQQQNQSKYVKSNNQYNKLTQKQELDDQEDDFGIVLDEDIASD